MNTDRLFEILDIDELGDFKYFDNLAILLETDEEIEFEEIYYIIQNVESSILSGLLDDYFEDLMTGIPDEETELFMRMDNIHRVLTGILNDKEDENCMVHLAEELMKFRNWYIYDTDVSCRDIKTGKTTICRMRDALILHRMAKIDNETYYFDFEGCLNYELDEYVMSLTANDENDTYDYTSGKEEEALLNSDFLYDDEFKDEY